MPQIRHRPRYPALAHDQTAEKANRDQDKCNKYYDQYGKRKLTGGIMVVWCRHSLAYGFHCIPNAEGRNDVFSALYTRWEVAPDVILYDFACALSPYCMTREPQFFARSFMAIDGFHAGGHSMCSPASMVTNYSATDPSLAKVNSSAAECGNGALSKIRTSVRYMGQRRAVIYTKTFLSIWNRMKMLRMMETVRLEQQAVERYEDSCLT